MSPVLTHLAMHVQDLDACIAFYEDFCGMRVVHERSDAGNRVVWLAEPYREQDFIFAMVPGGARQEQAPTDYSHVGFALETRAAVDAIADKGRAAGCLVWEPRTEPYPVG
ncbi:MAG: VOC family protein, partial [bacterium]|nr:VOC family protein [bacterium]